MKDNFETIPNIDAKAFLLAFLAAGKSAERERLDVRRDSYEYYCKSQQLFFLSAKRIPARPYLKERLRLVVSRPEFLPYAYTPADLSNAYFLLSENLANEAAAHPEIRAALQTVQIALRELVRLAPIAGEP